MGRFPDFLSISVAPLLLFSTSCTSPTLWRCLSLSTEEGGRKIELHRCIYPPSSPSTEMGVEIYRTQEEWQGYLYVLCYTFPTTAPYTTHLHVESTSFSRLFLLPLREGGQRASLSSEAFDCIFSALLRGEEISLRSGHFSQKIREVPSRLQKTYTETA